MKRYYGVEYLDGKKRGSRCGRADSVNDSHTTGPGFKTQLVRYFLLSFKLLTIITASS